jgi:hypothetical protein
MLYYSGAAWVNLATGTADQVLIIGSTGYPEWGTLSTVAGSDTQVQFNSGGAFAGDANFTFSSSLKVLTVSFASTTGVTATNFWGTLKGNADTATALAANPAACAVGQFVNDIAADGTLTCAIPPSASGSSKWATTTNNLVIYPASYQIVVVGGSASTSVGDKFEVIGNAKIGSKLTVGYASTTNLTVSGMIWSNLTGSVTGTASGNLTQAQASTTFVSRTDWTTHDSYPAACGAGQYVTQIGDTLTCGTPGTVTSVDMSVPTGLSIAGNPITDSGTLALTLTEGYIIPKTASTTNWNTAYDWGNHASGGYLDASGFYATTTHSKIATLPALKTYPAFSIASSTWNGIAGLTASSTIQLKPAFTAETWTGIRCATDAETALIKIGDGTNFMPTITASTTAGLIGVSSNNTFTAGEVIKAVVSNIHASVNWISCSVEKKNE